MEQSSKIEYVGKIPIIGRHCLVKMIKTIFKAKLLKQVERERERDGEMLCYAVKQSIRLF